MAVPFGFSAGDFMAAIHLVHKVNIALRDTDGASSQYNQTISELQGLEGLLRSVQGAHSADVDPQQLDKLQLLGHECYIPLNKFFSKIKVLEPSLGNLGTKNDRIIDRTKRTARKVQWGLQVKKELSELTAAMGPRINAINMQLLLINSERQEKAGSSLGVLMQTLNGLNYQMNNFQNHLDTRLDSLATMTSVDNVVRSLRDMRLEAANDRNAHMDTVRKHIDTHTGRFNSELSQQVLHSIELLDSKIQDHFSQSRTSTTQNTAIPGPVSKSHTPVNSGSLCHDRTAMQRVEEQLATQNRLLLLLTERDLSPQSSGPPSEENDHGVIQNSQETIRDSIQALLSFFRAGVNALLLKLWIALPIVQHVLRTLQAFPLLASVSIADSILFEDALGRIAHLPYVHFRHHAVFMARLRCEFQNVPGEQKVLLEQFRIFKQKRFDKLLTKENWERDVGPGSKIAMSVLLNSQSNEGNTCPRCGTIKVDMDAKDLSQWYFSRAVSEIMLTASSTVCGLSWALQKFSPPGTLSGADRAREAKLGQPLAPDVFVSAENESISSSTSSPDPAEVALPLIDNEDMESFKMVHIQSQNASADTEAISSIPSLLEHAFHFRNIRPWQHSFSRDLPVDVALMRVMEKLPFSNDSREGFIYIYWYEGSSQILKIGHTVNVEKRIQAWSRNCGVNYIFDPQLYEGTKMAVPFVGQVGRLIFTELKDHRMIFECNGCGKTHKEWFCVSKEHVIRVFQKWKDWISQTPYMQNDDREWVLEPSFLAHVKETCQPLAMND